MYKLQVDEDNASLVLIPQAFIEAKEVHIDSIKDSDATVTVVKDGTGATLKKDLYLIR